MMFDGIERLIVPERTAIETVFTHHTQITKHLAAKGFTHPVVIKKVKGEPRYRVRLLVEKVVSTEKGMSIAGEPDTLRSADNNVTARIMIALAEVLNGTNAS